MKLLALAPGHRLHREQVMDLLWPDAGKQAASNSMRQILYAARGVLDPVSNSPNRYLNLEDEWIALCPHGQLWIDVEAFVDAAVAARRSRDPATYEAALDLYAGDLLPEDRYEPWAEGKREELRQLYLALLVELATLYVRRQEYGPAVMTLQTALSAEPTYEEAHATLMRAYVLSEKQAEALAQYERLKQALSGRLGTGPGATTRALRDEIAAGRFPPGQYAIRSSEERSEASKHNLPVLRTSFVGRDKELMEVKRALAMTRLLTLTGAGGSGKTRLALETAENLVGSYPDGVWLVELAGLSEPELIPQAAANALGVREQPGRSVLEALVRALRGKKMLLVLDNCEHLLGAVVQLVETLEDASPDLRLLATSREALGTANELVWRVPPLSVPGSDEAPAAEELARSESARLFVERARYRNPAFALTSKNAGAVAQICRQLDGIPLAVELAAARAEMLSAEQIAGRLSDSLKLLTRGDRTNSPRQQTLESTMDWSYALLSEPERRLFRRLSVFAGGWTLEVAEVVGAGDDLEMKDVLDLLTRLADKSLITGDVAVDTAPRHRMHEVVRQYAYEKLEASGEADEVRHWHAFWFLRWAEEAELGSTGARQEMDFEKLTETEHDNLRIALSWLLDSNEAALALRLVAALWWFWYAHGYLSEGRRRLEATLAQSGAVATQAKAWALNGAGWITLFQGDFEAAKAFLEQALILFRGLNDKEGIASSLTNLGFVAMLGQRDDIPVPDLLAEARDLRPELRNRRTAAYVLLLEGVVVLGQGDHTRAMELHEKSLALLRGIRDVQGVGGCLLNMGLIQLSVAERSRATGLLREALRVAREADDKNIVQLALFGLANAAAAQRKPARAAQLWGASEGMRDAFNMRVSPMTRSFAGYESNLSSTRSRLGSAAFEQAWADGKAMTQRQAVEYALSEREHASLTAPVPKQALNSAHSASLTRREREVATLVTSGLTNRQIAAELRISERTAANHVARVLRKLGLPSRARIASWITERGAFARPDPDQASPPFPNRA